MDTAVRPDRPDLIDDLVAHGHRYDFFQAMLILEAVAAGTPGPGGAGPLREERLRFRSDVSLGFPATDIASLRRRDAQGGLELTLTFLGLCGSSTPLPGYFVEPVVRGADGGGAMRDFLAMFEHRLYSLYWRAWKKYRLDLEPDAPLGRAVRLLLHLAGVAPPGSGSALNARRVATHAGLLGTPRRTAAGLRGLVAGYFGGLPVQVVEGVLRRVLVRERPRLLGGPGSAAGARLGRTAMVGDWMDDRTGMVRLRIGPLGLDTYVALLPGGAWSRALGELVRLYLPPTLHHQVQLELVRAEIPGCRLGHALTRLGWLSWLGRPSGNGLSDAIPAAAFAAA
jgi:type VI secretion system protein ImpH